MRACALKDVLAYITAGSETYAFLTFIGTQIQSKGDEKNLREIREGILEFLIWIMFKTRIEELPVLNHCQNAVYG